MSASAPTVVIVSGSYSEPSLQRQITALARFVDVDLIAPEVAPVLVSPRFRAADHCDGRFRPVPVLPLFGMQFLFRSRDLGLPDTRPDLIHIEYDPWTVTFWQVRVLAWLFSRSSRTTSDPDPAFRGPARWSSGTAAGWSSTRGSPTWSTPLPRCGRPVWTSSSGCSAPARWTA